MINQSTRPIFVQGPVWRRFVWRGMTLAAGLFAIFILVVLDDRATISLDRRRQANLDGLPVEATPSPVGTLRRLEFQRGIMPDAVRAGWSTPDPNFGLWSDGRKASLAIRQPVAGRDTVLNIRMEAFVAAGRPWQRVHVTVSGRTVADWVIKSAAPATYRLVIPASGFAANSTAEIVFDLPDAASPASVDAGLTDRRTLAIALKSIDIDVVN